MIFIAQGVGENKKGGHWDVEQVEVEQGGKLSKWEVEQDGS